MFKSYAKATERAGKTPGIPPGAKFTLPKAPSSAFQLHHLTAMQRRQASVRYTPTRFHAAIPGMTGKMMAPGHVEWLFSPEELRRFEPLKNRLPADFWNLLLQVKDVQEAKGQPVTAGHAPDNVDRMIYRAWRVDGSFGNEYLNVDIKAAPWFAPHSTDDTTDQIDLGDFDDDTLVLLFDIMRQQPGWHYSARGKEGTPPVNLWNEDDWNFYLKNHVIPQGSPHCINFLVQCLERVAEKLAPGSNILLHLKQDLGYARQPQDIAAVLRAYFRVDSKRRPSLVSAPVGVEWPDTHIRVKPDAPASKPPQTKAEQVPAHPADHKSDDDDDDWIDTGMGMMQVPKGKAKEVEDSIKAEHTHATATPNYKEAEKAFAGDAAVFERIASQLIADGTVFAASFNKKEFLDWNNQTFKHIGEEMKRRPGKPVGVVLFHRNMYGDVTHISNLFISATGRVVIGHHESMDVGKAGMVDGLATGTVGCVSATYYTLMLHNAVRKMFALPPMTEDQLPANKSLAQTGTPTAHVIPIENYDAVEAFILRSACQSLTKFGLTVPYGVDPNPTLAKAAKDAAAGKLLTPLQAKLLNAEKHFAIHPKAHPPGGSGPFAPGEATNNCGRFTLLCLHAAQAPGVAGMVYSAEMDLADVAESLFKAGALPNTDPEVINLMRKGGYAKDPKTGLVTRHPLAFLALAFGWSLAPHNTPGAYPAHVDRVKMPEQDKLDAKLKDSWAKVLSTVQKNIDSFSTDMAEVHSALDVKKLPSPVQRVVTDADWQAVIAHVNALPKEERTKRFGVEETEEVIKELRDASLNGQHFYMLRDPKSHAVTLLLQIRLSSDGLNLNMEVGTSVLADHRGKGLGRWGIAWAIAWGQNRGAFFLRGDYDINVAPQVEKLLAKLNTPVDFFKPSLKTTRKEYVMALKPADHDTHGLEGFAQELQFDRNPPPKKQLRALPSPLRPHHQGHAKSSERGAGQRDGGDGLGKQQPRNQRGAWRHQVHQAGDRSRRTALDQQVQQRTAAKRKTQYRPGHGAHELGIPLHGFNLEQGQRQGDQQRCQELHRVGCAHIASRHETLLVERANGDGEQRHDRQRQVEPGGLIARSTRTKLARHHQHQPGKAENQTQPLPLGHFGAGAREPDGGEHRLQTNNERRQTRAHPRLDGHPDAAEVARVHEDTGDREVHPLGAVARPLHASQQDPGQKTGDGQRIADRQELHRRRVGHAEARHDEAGAPDEHKHPGHGAQPRVVLRRGMHEPSVPSAHSAGFGANFGYGLLQVIHHRPHSEHGRDPDQPGAPEVGVDHVEQRAVKQQERNGHHLHGGLDLADHVNRHALGGADDRHPFAQRRDGDLTANDDERHKDVGPVEVHQHQQRGTHQKLVGHRVQKGTEGRRLVELAGQVTIGPVGQREHNEHDRRDQVLLRHAHAFQIEHPHDQRDGHDAGPGEQSGKVEKHRPIMRAGSRNEFARSGMRPCWAARCRPGTCHTRPRGLSYGAINFVSLFWGSHEFKTTT